MTKFMTWFLLALLAGCTPQARQQPTGTAPPLTINSTEDQIRKMVGTARMGRKLTPKIWPNGASIAVCVTFDVDNELGQRNNPLPVPLSEGEYGATTAMP